MIFRLSQLTSAAKSNEKLLNQKLCITLKYYFNYFSVNKESILLANKYYGLSAWRNLTKKLPYPVIIRRPYIV